jgi:hypothetical protein
MRPDAASETTHHRTLLVAEENTRIRRRSSDFAGSIGETTVRDDAAGESRNLVAHGHHRWCRLSQLG